MKIDWHDLGASLEVATAVSMFSGSAAVVSPLCHSDFFICDF
jgi:hypothetical protein